MVSQFQKVTRRQGFRTLDWKFFLYGHVSHPSSPLLPPILASRRSAATEGITIQVSWGRTEDRPFHCTCPTCSSWQALSCLSVPSRPKRNGHLSSTNWLNHLSTSLFTYFWERFAECLVYAASPSHFSGKVAPVSGALVHPPPKLDFIQYCLSWLLYSVSSHPRIFGCKHINVPSTTHPSSALFVPFHSKSTFLKRSLNFLTPRLVDVLLLWHPSPCNLASVSTSSLSISSLRVCLSFFRLVLPSLCRIWHCLSFFLVLVTLSFFLFLSLLSHFHWLVFLLSLL